MQGEDILRMSEIKQNSINKDGCLPFVIITAGSTYLDIDAYACAVALAELLRLQGENAIAYSGAPCNYSVCRSLTEKDQISRELPLDFDGDNAEYIIVDVSDPEFLKSSAPLDKIVKVYDHHVGFEDYWMSRIGGGAHIEFIGAAATLIWREWKAAGLQNEISRSAARLLMAAILDNTLDLTSSNTTNEDREAFAQLCRQSGEDDRFRAAYFSEVQSNVEADLKNALFKDMKHTSQTPLLPDNMAQLCVWDAEGIFEKLPHIREWFGTMDGGWLLNLIDIKHRCSYFVCDDTYYQDVIEKIFTVEFEDGVARSAQPYLRKQIIKNVLSSTL